MVNKNRSEAAKRAWRLRKAYFKTHYATRKEDVHRMYRERGLGWAEIIASRVKLKPGTVKAWVRMHNWKTYVELNRKG
jgi:uncharacterized protein YjcR